MVVVSSYGGLANRMFQYAFYLALRNQGLEVQWEQKYFKPRSCMTCETTYLQDVFDNVRPDLYCGNDYPMAFWKRRWQPVRNICGLLSGKRYYYEKNFRFDSDIASKLKDGSIVIGSWQSEKYFNDVREEVLHAFEFPELTAGRNSELARIMSSCQSVALHIRKGDDYTKELLFKDTCPEKYFTDAIEYIKSKVESPVFFVFTDNPRWVRMHIKGIDYTLVDWNPTSGKMNYLDMQLMSMAKHNIISNSTYSWWGAWLNRNPEKIVIAPGKWFNPSLPHYTPNDVVCENWIKL